MRKAIVVGVGVLFISLTSARAEQKGLPLVGGDASADLQTKDVVEIMKLTTTKDSSPWLLEVGKMKWVRSLPLRVSVYLKPFVSTPRLRRGQVVLCFDEKRPGQEARSWSLGEKKQHYAQVSPKDKPFASEFTLPGAADRPFWVTGRIRDEDLVDLVDFIRTSPREPVKTVNTQRTAEGYRETKRLTEPVCGIYRILSVKEAGLGSFEIFTERREGAGQSIRVKLQDGGWKLLGVGDWFS
ncbi:MAG: hypothetical protein NT105_06595 [Verrucomicrobia bacterium]|nr:hypothetical protein [Verrucomicrobiota bacterium]